MRRYHTPLLFLLAALPAAAWADQPVAPGLPAQVVHVQPHPNWQGSGVLLTLEGDWYVLTCQHVATRASKGKNEWHPIYLSQRTLYNGKEYLWAKVSATVIGEDKEADLALARLDGPPPASWQAATLAPGDVPDVGTPVFHCGSPTGMQGLGTVTSGIVSAVGRVEAGGLYDQCSAPTFGGSSGGMIADARTGELLGILSRGPGETFSKYVPARVIHEFLKRHGPAPKVKAPDPAKPFMPPAD